MDARHVQIVDTVGASDVFMVRLLDELWGYGLLGADRWANLQRIRLDTLSSAAGRSGPVVDAEYRPDLPDRAAMDTQSTLYPSTFLPISNSIAEMRITSRQMHYPYFAAWRAVARPRV
ncbi:hypothetical protein ABFA25_12200 [Mycobacterium lepromatosis]|uniref:hypothetical protein n=1 Tax=Mycobacterium lepromatosis TaxID=480418 RepID=UPI001F26B188|nr:hypothetical protein [Mycobacterium lepromatosis]